MLIGIHDFLSLRNNLPVADVRSPLEFSEGHIPLAKNIPLLNNEERVAVGTDYKQKGQLQAIKTGFALVGPRLLNIIEETEALAQGKELLVYCWRGGMRSSNFCQFIGMAKIKSHQLQGGYKTYRKLALESFGSPSKLLVIGGCTGSGKSEILQVLSQMGEQTIGLEELANHKGSAFGGLMMPAQPTTEQFQNTLFETIRSLDVTRRIWIEDESLAIGKIFLPEPLWKIMRKNPVFELSLDKSLRINRLVNEYGGSAPSSFLQSMEKITKKLGPQHFSMAKDHLLKGDMHSVIEILLNYYDKAYLNGLEKKKERIKARITWDGENREACAQTLINHALALGF